MTGLKARTRSVSASIKVLRVDEEGRDHYMTVLATADVWFIRAKLTGPPEDCYEAEGDIENISTTIYPSKPLSFAGDLQLSEDDLSDCEWEDLRRCLFDSYLSGVMT